MPIIMRIILSWLINLLCLSCLSQVFAITLSVPPSFEVIGSGNSALAFVIEIKGIGPAEPRPVFSFAGLPAVNPLIFDQDSRLLLWIPGSTEVGSYQLKIIAADTFGHQLAAASTLIKVLPQSEVVPLPKGWEQLGVVDKYLLGRKLFSAANLLFMTIAANSDYQIEVRLKDSEDQECILVFLPQNGMPRVDKRKKRAEIMLGAEYRSDKPRILKRDLYEDLFDYLGLVLKKIVVIRVIGDYQLPDLALFNSNGLIKQTGIKNIYLPELNFSVDDRFYVDSLYSDKNPMLIADAPTIKIDFTSQAGLIWRSALLTIDDTFYSAAKGDFTKIVVKPMESSPTFGVDYALYELMVPAQHPLAFGQHHLVFEVSTAYGLVVTREVYARVVTLPAQVEGQTMVFPSPFNLMRDKELRVQYKLTQSTNIDLAVFGVDGSITMKKSFVMGENGGQRGLNTVVWDGHGPSGSPLPNGIYTGVIIDRAQNRVLEKFKITIFN